MNGPDTSRRSGDPVLLAFAAVGVGLAVAVLAVRPITDPDAWWNLKAGQYLLQTGAFAGPDPWSRFSSHEFVLTEWLGSVAAALLFEQFGAATFVWLRAVGVITLAVLMLTAARRHSDLPVAVIATLTGLMAASGSLSERPQTLGVIFLMVAVMAWRRAAMTLKTPWWLIPLTWLAATAHGYWALGIGVGLATLLGVLIEHRDFRLAGRFGIALAAMVAAASVTPVGPRLLVLPFQVHSAAGGLVDEWARPSIRDPLSVLGFVTCLVVAAIWLRRPSLWWERSHLVLAATFALSYVRLTTAAMCLLVPLLATALQSLRQGPPLSIQRMERQLLIASASSVVLIAAVLAAPLSTHLRATPVTLTPTLKAIPAGTVVLDDYNASSWMLFTFPELDLVIDSRTELFSQAYLLRYADAWRARPGWREYVSETGATWAVLRRASPLSDVLQDEAGWTLVDAGQGYVVLRERGAEH